MLWKNSCIMIAEKWRLALCCGMTIMALYLLILINSAHIPEARSSIRYPPLEISNLDGFNKKMVNTAPKPKMKLLYSPENKLLDNIVQDAVASLNLKDGHAALPSASALEKALKADNYFVGVQFDDALAEMESYPQDFVFTLRFPSYLRTSKVIWPTERLVDALEYSGPRNYNDTDGGTPGGYLAEGFLAVQHAISMSYLKLATNNREILPQIKMQRFPYPEHIYIVQMHTIKFNIILPFLICFIYPLSSITKFIVSEKEKQLKEVMKIMGLTNIIHWASWFVVALIILMVLSILLVVGIKIFKFNGSSVLNNCSLSVFWFFILVYAISAICFTFMFTTFFKKAALAAMLYELVAMLLCVPFMYIALQSSEVSLVSQLGLSLIYNTALGFGNRVLLNYEVNDDGLQWRDIFSPISPEDNSTLGAIILMMLISSVICMLICLYVEEVFPGEFGVPRKWYFPFTAQFWRCGRKNHTFHTDVDNVSENWEAQRRNINNTFEPEPLNVPVGVRVMNLKKKFGNNVVVKGVTFNMYQNEMTALLGHNGAGKTTTISMLTGIIPPTSGTGIINGYDVRTDMEIIRKSLSICPQQNVLFDGMSVSNHIVFYCRLKGVNGKVAMKRELNKYLNLLKLKKKANIASYKLSGGMKRKLSVCCALCGGTEVVFLDEPTSGMDPAARRQLWNLLQHEKLGRTIMFTTHYMDEADVLGDRIAIMCDGELKCYGTSFFLKKKLGSGYRVICVKRENCNVDQVTTFISQYIPGITPESNIGSELTYQLPDRFSYLFESLLKDLENKANDLNLDGYGIGITSMEEIFMKVGNENAGVEIVQHDEPNNRRNDGGRGSSVSGSDVESSQSDHVKSRRLVTGSALLANQWHAMFLKMSLYTYRNTLMFLIATVILFVGTLMPLIQSNSKAGGASLPSINISLNQYKDCVLVLEREASVADDSLEGRIVKQYRIIATSTEGDHTVEMTGKHTFSDYILELGHSMQARINTRYLAAATIAKDSITVWFNNQYIHTAPLSLNLIHNAIARALINPSARISVINAPLPFTPGELQNQMAIDATLPLVLPCCMAFVIPLYIMFPITERRSGTKLLQYISGVGAWTFWLTHLLWDMLIFTLWVIIINIILVCLQLDGLSTFSELGRYWIVLITFGFAAISLMYFLSLLLSNTPTGYSWGFTIGILGVLAIMFIVMADLLNFNDTAKMCLGALRIIPHTALGVGIQKLHLNYAISRSCKGLEMLPENIRCEKFPPCCDEVSYFAWKNPGILQELVFMIAVAIGCFLFLIVWDTLLNNSLFKSSSKRTTGYEDDDVERERERILKMSKDEIAKQNLVLDRLTKYFGRFRAVNQISLAVQEKECFGLLGVNGAGKTATFRMLTGDESISSGTVYVQGMNLNKKQAKVYRKIGYCPQFDALFDDFTGRETLKIVCLLRGTPKKKIDSVSNFLARSLGFKRHIDKQAKVYSGGNKRKLSTALAVIGSPSIIYLDEPTSGVDPAARRQIWNLISSIRDSGRSIVLSSHSMEECEALCTRLAIMVNGEFVCIGPIQYLKNKFSKGLMLKVKLKRNTGGYETDIKGASAFFWHRRNRGNNSGSGSPRSDETLQQNINDFKTFVLQQFPEAVLQEEYQGVLTFYIPLTSIQWSTIFGVMERNRKKLNIEDYYICQMRLEDIFLDFAKHQREDKRIAK